MSSSLLRIRRATMDDFRHLQALWQSMKFPSDTLEKRLTEFHVVETVDGQLAGAIGLQIVDRHGLLHSEGYTDFSLADKARELFWERIQTVAAHHGVLRLWTQENSPFWVRWGFQPAPPDILERLPDAWKHGEEPWLTFQLKDEAALAAIDKELEVFRESGKKRTVEALGQARTMTNTVTFIALLLAAVLFGIAFFMFVRRFLPGPGH